MRPPRKPNKKARRKVENKVEGSVMTFWDHLEELRGVLFRMVVGVIACMLCAFLFKDTLFSVVMAPHESDFCLYRLLCRIGDALGMPGLCPGDFHVMLINTQLAGQFVTHMTVAFYAGIIVASPYIIYLLFHFISPALYQNERRYALRVVASGYVLFIAGVLLNYFLIYPLTFRFLALYQVSAEVQNTITLNSYIDTLVMMSLMMGIVFEIPILCWLLAKLGFLTSGFMVRYRRHSAVAILVIAAIITPTSDVFTLLMVACPMLLLYEISIGVVKKTQRIKEKEAISD